MSFDDGSNPFADAAIRQPTTSTFSNQPTSNDNNPFANTTTSAQPASPPPQPSAAAYLTPSQPPTYQPSAYTPVPTPVAAQKPKDPYIPEIKPASTHVDLSQYEQQQADLEAREKRVAERERVLANAGRAADHDNNFPPLPYICPCKPCFYQDINLEIPLQFQRWVRYSYYLWLFYSLTLFLNMIAALSYFIGYGVSGSGATFGLSLLYLVLFIPVSYICWFRPIYRAFNGFARAGALSENIVVGVMMIIIGSLWAFIAVVAIILTIQVHRLYRQTGASLEQAHKDLQTAFINNETVRGAAREVAAAGINEALRSND